MSDDEDFNLDVNILTITVRKDNDLPEVDIGNMNPIEAFGLLTAAIQTVNLLIPHCDILSNGKEILSILDLDPEDETPE